MKNKQNMKTKHKNRVVVISTPCIDGKFDYRFMCALMESTTLLQQNGIRLDFQMEVGCSLIADARCRMAAYFLNSKASDMVFIDSDISWKPADLLRLLSWDEPLVGATYQLKKEDKVDFAIKFPPQIGAKGELLTASRLPTGFLRIRRDCLEEMIKHADKIGLRNYYVKNDDSASEKQKIYAFFDAGIYDEEYIGEDYFFSQLWSKMGKAVLLDPEIVLGHIASRVFNASIKSFLKPAKP